MLRSLRERIGNLAGKPLPKNDNAGQKSFLRLEEHELMCVSVVLITIVIALFLGLAAVVIIKPSGRTYSICSTSNCKLAAEYLKNSINSRVSPCNDFYSFACGNWLSKHKLPEGKELWSVNDIINNETQVNLKELLLNTKVFYASLSLENARQFYQLCQKTQSKSENSLSALRRILLGSNGTDPNFVWSARIGEIAKNYFQHFIIKLLIETKENNFRIYLSPGSFGMELDDLLSSDTKKLESYKKAILDVFCVVEINCSQNETMRLANDIVDFEVSLAKLVVSNATALDQTIIQYGKLDSVFPKDSVTNFVNTVLGTSSLASDTPVFVLNEMYFSELGAFMEKNDKRVISKYLDWRLMQNIAPFQTDCLDIVSYYFNEAIVRFATKFLTNAVNNEAIDLSVAIVRHMKNSLFKHDWLTSEMKNFSYHKLDLMKKNVGFFPWILNDNSLDRYYNFPGIVSEKEYYSMVLKIGQQKTKRMIQLLTDGFGFQNWYFQQSKAECRYSMAENKLTFTPYYTKLPFYRQALPIAMRYAGVGFLLASEAYRAVIKQDVDDKYNDTTDAELRNRTLSKYMEKHHCFENQYERIEDVLTNSVFYGNRTMDQNIADNAAVRAAYEAFSFKALSDVRLDGFKEYNGHQLFFITFAACHCANISASGMLNLYENDRFLPVPYRINLALSNMPEFSEAFNCGDDAPMNPKSKCEMW